MKTTTLLLLFSLCYASSYADDKGKVSIVQDNGRYSIALDGSPTYIKGVGGTFNMDVASECGANACRTWGGTVESISRDVEKARQHGMLIMQGIEMSKDVNMYHDETYKQKKRDEVRLLAETFKDCPQIFAWGVGNEVELAGANGAEVWSFIDELAQIIKSIDHRHLVSNVLCIPMSLDSIAKYAPNLDFVGINTYGSINILGDAINRSTYKGAFMITEWGPNGFWEVPTTEWKAQIEQTSEEKRRVYEQRYRDYILANPRCMGSFVFLWGQKEERTPTWFSMFIEKDVQSINLNGEKTPTVEAMERVWTGQEPKQTAPVMQQLTINGKKATESVTLKAGDAIKAKANVFDREQQQLTYTWEILREATVLGFGGSFEPRPERVEVATQSTTNTYQTVIREPGNYRLYVYAFDGTGFVATANVPFKITL